MHLVSIRATLFTQQKQWDLYQNKVTSSLAAIQRPGHWADNCKMVYQVYLDHAYEVPLANIKTERQRWLEKFLNIDRPLHKYPDIFWDI